MSLPVPAFAGGTKAITLTPVVGALRREYAEMFIPGAEEIEDGTHLHADHTGDLITLSGSRSAWRSSRRQRS
jgi:hypothetical protein